jgi:hypothetical protein
MAGRGDLIVCLPGHSETFTTNVTIPSGVTIMGLGYAGARPLITCGSSSATLRLGGPGIQLNNLRLDFSTVALSTPLVVAQSGFQLINCRIIQVGASVGSNWGVILASGADDFVMYQCEIDATGGSTSAQAGFASTSGATPVNRTVICNNYIHGSFAIAPFNTTLGSSTTLEMLVQNNVFVQRNTTANVAINILAGSSGVIAYNDFVAAAPTTLAGCITVGASPLLNFSQNYVYFQKAGPFSGILCPAAGTIP